MQLVICSYVLKFVRKFDEAHFLVFDVIYQSLKNIEKRVAENF